VKAARRREARLPAEPPHHISAVSGKSQMVMWLPIPGHLRNSTRGPCETVAVTLHVVKIHRTGRCRVDVRQTDEFSEWLDGLRDTRARQKVIVRLVRLGDGNPGDVAPVGEGISELRIPHGPGYRVYYKVHDGAYVSAVWRRQVYADGRHQEGQGAGCGPGGE
jgi:putative addiction module killer protein